MAALREQVSLGLPAKRTADEVVKDHAKRSLIEDAWIHWTRKCLARGALFAVRQVYRANRLRFAFDDQEHDAERAGHLSGCRLLKVMKQSDKVIKAEFIPSRMVDHVLRTIPRSSFTSPDKVTLTFRMTRDSRKKIMQWEALYRSPERLAEHAALLKKHDGFSSSDPDTRRKLPLQPTPLVFKVPPFFTPFFPGHARPLCCRGVRQSGDVASCGHSFASCDKWNVSCANAIQLERVRSVSCIGRARLSHIPLGPVTTTRKNFSRKQMMWAKTSF
jgi:hypothetical protein